VNGVIIIINFYPYVNFYVSYFTGVIIINYNLVSYAFHAHVARMGQERGVHRVLVGET
jgi:hypothetical protein